MQSENYGPYGALLENTKQISERDVTRLRREVFQDGIVSANEAEAVFALNDAIETKCAAWNEYFIEVMTDYTVMQAEPRGYVSTDNAKWLVQRISHDGVVDSATELELLVRIMARASDCPSALAGFALAQVSHAVVEGEGPLSRGKNLQKGVIGAGEVELLRTVLYAAGGANGLSISRQEAEILFDLNERTDTAANHPSWQDLFVRATANYLMAAASWHAPDRSQALARQEWLEDTESDVSGSLLGAFSGITDLFSEGFFDDVFTSSHVQMERAWRENNERMKAQANQNEAIDSQEAKWLIDRINRDGKINNNEQALLEFIRAESSQIDPGVLELMNKVA